MMKTLKVAAVVLLAACAGDRDPIATVSNGSIRGTVTDNAGTTVANASVALSGNGQAGRSTNSTADGVYTFLNVPPGTYTVAVTPPAGYTLGSSATTSVTVASAAEASPSAIVLNRVVVANGSITGVVTDNAGAKVANVAVVLTGNGQSLRTTSSDANGAYAFADVPPGSYVVGVTPPAGFTVGSASANSIMVASGAQANVTALVLVRATPLSFAEDVHARLVTATAANEFTGAVLITRNGSTIFEGAYGLADRALGTPNTLLTKFRVGSMNKMLTAVAILQLAQAGKVQLSAPFGTYLTDYPNAEMASKVTLHHLLTHTGGTGDIFGPQFNANRLTLRNTSDYLNLYGTRGLQFEPGSQWVYSNYGFMLLGAVIERVTGMSYDDYIAANVLTPAGMTDTGAAPEDVSVTGRAVGYMWQGGTLVSNSSTLPYRGTPAGGWYSTVSDMARFAAAVREHKLLDAKHTDLLITGKIVMGQSIVKYAYGFVDRVQGGRRLVGHSGGAAGMSGELSFEPAGGYTVVVLSNLSPQAAGMMEAFILSRLP